MTSLTKTNTVSKLHSYAQKRQTDPPTFSCENNTGPMDQPTMVTVTCKFRVQQGFLPYKLSSFPNNLRYEQIKQVGKKDFMYKFVVKYQAYSKSAAKCACSHILLRILFL